MDEDTPPAIAAAIRQLRPEWDALAAQDWLGKRIKDQPLLEALAENRRAIITKDRASVGEELSARQAAGRDHAGVLFWDTERFCPRKLVSFGALARSAVLAVEAFRGELWNVVYTLR